MTGHVLAAARRKVGVATRRTRARLSPASDDAFIGLAYRSLLGRAPDEEGLAHYRDALRRGMPREAVVLDLASSPEHRDHLTTSAGLRVPGLAALDDLTALRPDRYLVGVDLQDRELLTFEVSEPDDFDWLEAQLATARYYEQGGVWSLDVDLDKRLMAELVASLEPDSVLEIGCSSGAVLSLLAARGIDVTGVDVSEHARAQAPTEVRDRILIGDLLTIDVPADRQMVVGLDIFEHLNPNRLPAYLERLTSLLAPGGWCVANIPAFGEDPVFGRVFDDYLVDPDDPRYDELFPRLHVDDKGYPLHGHLGWATWRWWTARFEDTGLVRRPEIERALHARYRAHLATHAPARQSLFVFRKPGDWDDEDRIATAVSSTPSAVLREQVRA